MKNFTLKTLLFLAIMLIGGGNCAWADIAYWTEDFEDDLASGWTLSGSTGHEATITATTSEHVVKKLGDWDLRMPQSGSYVITPTLSEGVSSITFWQCRSANRTLTIYTSTDDGTNWTKHSDISANSSAIATVTINNPFVNRIKITNESASDADLDDLTVYHKNVVWKENYESYTDVSQISSAWTNNGSNYQATLNLCSNECGNSSKWLLTYSGNESRQTTEYYMFASAYTGKAYRFDAKLNMNDGNNNSSESRLYIMNGAKASNNDNPSNYLFYIGVNSSGMAYISNGTDSETSTIGGLNSGTNSIAATKWSKTYRSTGWFDASCIIDFENGTVSATFKSGSTEETKSLTLKSGTKQLSGIGVLNGAKVYGVVAMDDIALYDAYPKFELSETLKEVAKGGNTTINVTDLIGEISITSADANIATASYANGTITINGVALGTTTLTVSCTNVGFTVSKEIAVTVEHGVTYNTPALYSEDFESYDIEKETPDNPTAAGWTIVGGSSKIEENSNASINQCAWFNANNTSGNRGQYYNFASSVVSDAANYWKIEFDAALTAGSDRTESSVAVTSAKSGNVDTNGAASGDLYFLCKQKTSNSNEYEVFLGNSTNEASATYTLTNGTFYHFVITYNGTTVTAKIGSNAKISKEVNASTVGALKGLKTCESRGSSCIVRIDNITLHNFNGPAFTLAETEKTINQGGNGTVSVTDVVGEISVESDDTSVATASYADGTITITGVGGGTANITVNCFNNGVSAPAGTIEATIISYADQYTTAKAVYDAKVENLDAAGQTYWTSNVTDAASVVDASSYSAAIAALPTTYLAAVKAQGAGSDMTEAMPSALTDWTCSQGNGPGTYATTFTETYSDGTNKPKFVAGDIMSQTISGLPAGYYRVQFYGVVNSAWSVSDISGTTSNLVQAYANSTTADIDVYAQTACTPTDYLRTIEAEVTESGTLTYGLKAKDGVTDAGNWAVAKIYSLTYLGTGKNDYTINAVAGETTIKQLSTGEAWASDDYGTYVPYVILYNSKYYVLDDNSTYYKNFTMGASDATKEVSYTLDESIAAFVEGESMAYVGHSYYGTLTDRSDASNGRAVTVYTASNDGGARTSQVAGKGIYNISVAFVTWGTNTEDFDLEYSTDGTNYSLIKSFNLTSGPLTITTNVELPSASYIRLMNKTKATPRHSIDYVLIRKISDASGEVVGDLNYTTDYLEDMTDKVTLSPGESYNYKFINYNSNGSDNSKNWILPVYASGAAEPTITLRADRWEDKAESSDGFEFYSKGSDDVWADFINQMNGATVDMTISYSNTRVVNVACDIITKSGYEWVYNYTSDYTGSTRTFAGDIDVALSVSLSWLEILAQGNVFTPQSSANLAGYKTFYNADSNYEVDANTTIYIATAPSSGAENVVLTPVTGKVIPAKTPVILKTTNSAGEYAITLTPTNEGATDADEFDANGLQVATASGSVAGAYVLAYTNANGLGFYPYTGSLAVGNVYIKVSGSAKKLSLVVDGQATEVVAPEVADAEEEEVLYNMAGLRVGKDYKGIVINQKGVKRFNK